MHKEGLFHRLPRSAYLWIGIIALILMPWVVGASGGNYWVRVLDFALLYIVLALGLNVVVGFAGLLDLGYIAFYALGAYSYALLASPHLPQQFEAIATAFPQGMHFSPWMVAMFSIILAALFGIVLGFPTLQLRGDYLAIVTLGFGEIIRIFMNNLDRPLNLTNGPKGINAIDPIHLFGISFAKPLDLGFIQIPGLYLVFYLFLLLAVCVAIVCLHLQDSRIGRAWVAIREDEIAAKAMGINTRNMKLLAFAIGIGHIPGVILGAVLLAIFPEVLRGIAQPLQQALFGHVVIDVEIIRQLIYGLALILIMLYRPGGIWQKSGASS